MEPSSEQITSPTSPQHAIISQTENISAQPMATPQQEPRNYLSRLFTERINRRNYILGLLIVLSPMILSMTIVSLLQIVLASDMYKSISSVLSLFQKVYIFIYIFYAISLTVRRFHDLNRSGWFIFLSGLPLINLFVFFFIYFWHGTVGDNKYGKQPLPRINIKQDMLRLS